MPQPLTKEQALQKLRQFCAYQERSHYDVQQKLYSLKVARREHDEIIATLIEENYLNGTTIASTLSWAKAEIRNRENRKGRIFFMLHYLFRVMAICG